jgi:hypothetical protein
MSGPDRTREFVALFAAQDPGIPLGRHGVGYAAATKATGVFFVCSTEVVDASVGNRCHGLDNEPIFEHLTYWSVLLLRTRRRAFRVEESGSRGGITGGSGR